MKRSLLVLSLLAGVALVGVTAATADSIGPINFEPTGYAPGNINGQSGWTKTGGYDVAVATVSSFTAAAGYGFGTQALRLSNAVTSTSYSDQTFAPAVTNAAGESTGYNHFDASFSIGTALAAEQTGLTLSVSPDDGTGNRMSYLRFEDQADGVHVFFDDATDAGPLGTGATFNEHDIATLDRAHAHTVRFSIDFVPGAANDVVKIYLDGVLKATGTTWEDYYRYDPEQAGNHNVVPVTKTLLFRESGTAVAANNGNGFLVDNVSLASSNITGPTGGKGACKHHGWQRFSFRNQGQCIRSFGHHGRHGSGEEKGEGHGKGSSRNFASYGSGGSGGSGKCSGSGKQGGATGDDGSTGSTSGTSSIAATSAGAGAGTFHGARQGGHGHGKGGRGRH